MDLALPARALEAVRSNSLIENVAEDYREPHYRMMMRKWPITLFTTLSESTQKHKAIDDWLIINQEAQERRLPFRCGCASEFGPYM